jgi:hypothetical protein
MKLAVSIIAVGLLASGATSAFAQNSMSPAPDMTKDAGGQAAAGHIPPPPAGKAQVVFFRTGAYVGAGAWFKVRENGAELGKLTNQSYFVAVVDPGPHAFTAATESRNTLKLELDDGDTAYVRGTLQMGIVMGEPNLAPSDQALFEMHYPHMHLNKTPAASASKDADKPAS